ncbi:MAG: helix-turn-helix domain-containing protein, partial [Geminicoccaceae bacterium]
MAQTVSILLCGDDRTRLEAIVADRNRRHKHVQRAQIVLLSAARQSVAAIAQTVGVSRPSVWRWRQRFAEDGVAGLLKDRYRPPGKPRLSEEVELKVVALTCSEPPG